MIPFFASIAFLVIAFPCVSLAQMNTRIDIVTPNLAGARLIAAHGPRASVERDQLDAENTPLTQITPYSFWVANETAMPFWGFSVCWRGISRLDGSESRRYVVVIDTQRYRAVLGPKESQLVSPLGTAKAQQSTLGVIPDLALKDVQTWIGQQATISVELDSILLSDFTVAGADRARLRARLEASANAERDLLGDVVNRAQSNGDLRRWLDTVKSGTLSSLGEMRGHSLYTSLYNRNRASVASLLIRLIDLNGLAVAVKYAETELTSDKFPATLLK